MPVTGAAIVASVTIITVPTAIISTNYYRAGAVIDRRGSYIYLRL